MSDEDRGLEIVSHFPGRLRVRARLFREAPEVAEAAEQRLRDEPGVLSTSASALTGSILVLYDPGATQADTLIAALLAAGGLTRVAADAEEHALAEHSSTPLATRVRETFAGLDAHVFHSSNGKLDLRTAVPGALVLTGVTTLLLKKSFSPPQWYDLVFWSYVTFNNLHLVRQGTRSDAR